VKGVTLDFEYQRESHGGGHAWRGRFDVPMLSHVIQDINAINPWEWSIQT
jgi:hypothetical protein